MRETIAILDVETTGLDPEKDQVIEACVLRWDVRHRCIVEITSTLFYAAENPCESINGIPSNVLLDEPEETGSAWNGLAIAVLNCSCIVAHNAHFDRSFCGARIEGFYQGLIPPWVCTSEDFKWPKTEGRVSLINTALAHGVAVTNAHRAIYDCLLLARLFETLPDIDDRLADALVHAKLPKGKVISLAPYSEKDAVKAHGFQWDPDAKQWWRHMAVDDSHRLPFKTRWERP